MVGSSSVALQSDSDDMLLLHVLTACIVGLVFVLLFVTVQTSRAIAVLTANQQMLGHIVQMLTYRPQQQLKS